MAMHNLKRQYLGDVLESGAYLGACFLCRTQFLSTHDRVVELGSKIVCERCADQRDARHAYQIEHTWESYWNLVFPQLADSLMTLEGLGAEIWADQDAQDYVSTLRGEWAALPSEE
jgi:hypothetical protein